MEYEAVRAISGTLGLLIFVGLFVGVLVYALWPKNRSKFDHAANIPLNDDTDDTKLSRGGCCG
ncbi:MAG: cbb3-type cytochrome c oxidase subunit 3 [Alphaproteobacteria bacterium]|nr:cbb3-type cytochrome c oxidase subunit 3 [Alphaproteobacteria bacterium]